MYYKNIIMKYSNIKKLILSLTIAIVSFVTTITISSLSNAHASDSSTYWKNKINSSQQQLHNIGDKAFITKHKGEDIYLTKTDHGNLLVLNNNATNNFAEGECIDNIKYVVDAMVSIIAIAGVAVGVTLFYKEHYLTAAILGIVGNGVAITRDQLVDILTRTICNGDTTTDNK